MARNRQRRPRDKGGSRARQRDLLAQRAAQVALPAQVDVCVVGGGASGLVAATCAAEAGASVVLVERDLDLGRSILATGNGRCNFCNVDLDLHRYRHPDFVGATFGERPLDEILAFWRDCGLRWSLEGDRLYPLSRRAASVRQVLLARARRSGALLAPGRAVTSCRRVRDGFDLVFTCDDALAARGVAAGSLHARRVVWAVGGTRALGAGGGAPAGAGRPGVPAEADAPLADLGTAAAGLADLGTAAAPLADLGLPILRPHPVLCPVACKDDPLLALDGRRFSGAVSLIPAGRRFPDWRERGEVMLRGYGLSGIVVFDLSRRVQPGDTVGLDLAPDLSPSELRLLVDPRARGSFQAGCLDGVLDPDIAALLEELAQKDPTRLTGLVKDYRLEATGLAETGHAQVMAGGLDVAAFDPQTLESQQIPGFFACGEALDVDADCGGFNLAWAWKSGLAAGVAAGGAAADAGTDAGTGTRSGH